MAAVDDGVAGLTRLAWTREVNNRVNILSSTWTAS